MTDRTPPRWNWQSDDWGIFHHDIVALMPALAAARRAQGEVLGLAKALGMQEAQHAEALIWVSDSLATAAIEGEQLDLAGVRSSVARRLGLPGGKVSRARATEGLLDMMQDATTGWEKPLSVERLCGWQNALFPAGFSSIHRVLAGAFRTHAEPMQIVSGPVTRRVLHFEAPPSRRVPRDVARFLKWFNGPSRNMDGVLRAGIAHLWFESIHPFEDGNGRVGRALADMALAQDLRTNSRLASLSTELSAERDAYYTELHAASRANADNTRWLLWFCGRMEAACRRSSTLMHAALDKARYWAGHAGDGFDHNQRKVINRLLDAGPRGFEGDLTTAKYVNLTGVSRATAFRDLAALVATGALGTVGAGKATRYFINLPAWEPPATRGLGK
ncbi:MAG: Fic family protein [Betaproteobacteria bacterium]|nr:Fic family protein [Betaproteobacteria bacterium]